MALYDISRQGKKGTTKDQALGDFILLENVCVLIILVVKENQQFYHHVEYLKILYLIRSQ